MRRRLQAIAGERDSTLVIGAAFFPDDGLDAEDLLSISGRRLHGAGR
jgi:hypothetical protein